MTLRIAVANSVFCSLAMALYINAGIEPTPIVGWWLTTGPAMTAIIWVYRDARQRHVGDVTDLGFFLMFFWPVALPWFAFRSRGRAGWRLLLGLAALGFGPMLIGVAFTLLVRG